MNFNGVNFESCVFTNIQCYDTSFLDCSFNNNEFVNVDFHTVRFGMMCLDECVFDGGMMQFVTFSDCLMQNIKFKNIEFHANYLESGDMYYATKTSIIFEDSLIQDIVFKDLDMRECLFIQSEVQVTFINVVLPAKVFTSCKKNRVCNIDFMSISQSDNIDQEILHNFFDINSPVVRDIVKRLTVPTAKNKVFICYSLADEIFAEALNTKLQENNITTFFWKKDASGARKMKEIMQKNIRHYDFFLLIASKHSLKSDACHFEINEARKKYRKIWKNILIPIHIDDFFLQVEEFEIPLVNRALFWENIVELREFHSLDFRPIELKENGQLLINNAMLAKDLQTSGKWLL